MVWRGPIYWDLGQKITKNPDTSSSFFEVFFGNFEPLYTGDRTPYTGKIGNFTEIRVKNRDFSHISLCAKFNRFFIILGGGSVDTSKLVMEDL